LGDFQKKHGRKARDIKISDWAQKGGVMQLLLGRFVIASEALHFSPKSLDRLMIADGDRLETIRIGPEQENIDHLILSSCKYAFVGIQTLARCISVDVPEVISTLYARFQECYERMANEALATGIGEAS